MTRTPILATSGTSEGEEPVHTGFTGNFGTTTGAREVQYNGQAERMKLIRGSTVTTNQGFEGLRMATRINLLLMLEAAEHLEDFRNQMAMNPDRDERTFSKVSWWLKRYEEQRKALTPG
jgi:hypothetical protein